MKIVLYDWPPSPFCIKVRAVLARKGIAYEKVPALSRLREITKRGGIGKVPALDIDGEFLVDSTDIARTLDARFADPPLVPPHPHERALCHALEDWSDEALYFIALWHHWHEPAGRKQAQRYFAKTILGRVLFWPYVASVERQLKGQGTGRKTAAHIARDMERNLDAIEDMLDGRDFLLGEGPRLCDYAVGGQLVYLMRAPKTRDVLASRPRTRAFLARMPEVRV